MEQTSIYIVFSSTPYKIGKMIRKITKTQYNHVSISLDQELTEMYSFARRNYHAPLLGGFVKESPARFHLGEKRSHICICQIPVTADQHQDVAELLHRMYNQQEHYLYNHLSAIGSLAQVRIPAKDAFTCVEFTVAVLHRLGFPVALNQYYSIPQLWDLLEQNIIYTGFMPDSLAEDPAFYARKPISQSAHTVRDLAKLLPRSLKK